MKGGEGVGLISVVDGRTFVGFEGFEEGFTAFLLAWREAWLRACGFDGGLGGEPSDVFFGGGVGVGVG